MTPDLLKCPYCNQKLLHYTAPAFISECCGKLVGVKVETVVDVNVFVPVKDYLVQHRIEHGDITPIRGVTVRSERNRVSDWTRVYWHGDWYVRIIGGFDLEKARLPHGLSLGTKFSTVKEACDHADFVDRILDMIKAQIVEGMQK